MTSPKRPRHNLPADVTSFVGRGRELREIRGLLAQTRLLTLTGVGGVGKSRIARCAALAWQRAFPDGVWLTDFSSVRDGGLVEQAIQDSGPAPSSVLPLADQLRDQRALLLLDNCDRLHREIGDVVAGLLARCPELRVLATSRAPLGISAEYLYPVQPFGHGEDLPAGDGVLLFRERAGAAGAPGLGPGVDEAIARLCARLDGLPLAIELAALRTRTMSVEDIEGRLDDRFGLLRGGPRDLHPRHRSLWTLLEWTWEQCGDEQRSLWAQLSVFAGPTDLAAIRAVCEVGPDAFVDDGVDDLLEQSVLTREATAPVQRFGMLDTIREFGRLKLEADGAALVPPSSPGVVQDRCLSHYARSMRQAEAAWFGPGQVALSARVAGDLPNLRAVIARALDDPEHASTAAGIVADLWFHWIGCGHLKEGRLWCERVLDRNRELGRATEARLLWPLGWDLLITGEVDRAAVTLETCVEQAGAAGDARAAAFGRALLGAVAFFRGDDERGLDLYAAALEDARSGDDDLAVAVFLYQLAEACCVSGDLDRADELCDECVALCDARGDLWCRAYAAWIQALVAFSRGADERAAEAVSRALRSLIDIDDQLGIALVAEVAGWVAARQGRYADAATLLGATGAYWAACGSATVLGLSHLVGFREDCLTVVAARLSERGLVRATETGVELGLTGVAARVLHGEAAEPASARVGVAGAVAVRPGNVVSPPTQPLTQRELEIAHLVARGLTNKEIAAELVIGKRTVDTHVAHVLAKWGIRRRSEIASLVATQDHLD